MLPISGISLIIQLKKNHLIQFVYDKYFLHPSGHCWVVQNRFNAAHNSSQLRWWELGGWVIATAAMLSSVLLVASFSCSPPVLSL